MHAARKRQAHRPVWLWPQATGVFLRFSRLVLTACVGAMPCAWAVPTHAATKEMPIQATKPDQAVPRIITLAPHVTEMVFAAGAGRYIVGTVSSSNYPPLAKKIPRVGNGIQLSAERIVALRPSLILAWRSAGAVRRIAPLVSQLHIPIVYIAPRTLHDIPDDIIKLGQRLGTERQARKEAKKLSGRIKALAAKYAQRKPVSVYIEVGAMPLYTLGKDPLTNDALRVCGGVNVFAGTSIPAPQVSAESVLEKQPDAVIIPTTNAKHLAARTAYWAGLHLPAALAHHVYGINPDKLFRPGPRLVDATEELCKDLDQARRPR